MKNPLQWSKMTYLQACQMAALNDEPAIVDKILLENFTSTWLIAYIFARTTWEVAADIAKLKLLQSEGAYQTSKNGANPCDKNVNHRR